MNRFIVYQEGESWVLTHKEEHLGLGLGSQWLFENKMSSSVYSLVLLHLIQILDIGANKHNRKENIKSEKKMHYLFTKSYLFAMYAFMCK